jgi:YesN/AraC family two-component response regulator
LSIQGIIAKNRASGFRHHAYEMEQQFIAAIVRGDFDEAIVNAQRASEVPYKDVLAPQPLRAQKNMAISIVAVVSRAIIEHGADSETVFFLSDYFLNEIELVTSNKDLEQLFLQMFSEYSRISKESVSKPHSPIIHKCLQLISNRIYDRCTIEDIAIKLHISPDYLSQLFKKEMGVGMYSYILQMKIEEAKKLIDNSKFALSEIGDMLGFCNGAYFSNVFKKITGQSPKDYRRKLN